MDKQLQDEGKRWFIHRFCPSETTTNFCLKLHGLVEMTDDQRWKLTRAKTKQSYQRYLFQFQPGVLSIAIVPITAEAEWLRGYIWKDAEKGVWYFKTAPETTLFTLMDEELSR